ncbi:hypothetical protein DICPUDRAFT_82742 [Dictyostelium purpureum]|uniref:Rab-GAP TBC domain-containing protein n=1 Tax=Dictyostelium purpureum TaxID=5786 RepID=F0ZXF9_DICPU|nr:uncharacterized protein DICPUDRAFT_82742 [Dictyostelium purpureum]EGC31378.1 hypothetical protein DICPUDRAFT_82742 [Dictyostelium purpureum]|eukprot:XP_003292099.1 hypothetical protein DICPUDRAFT_82742 [Dictyostelium purpureum]
MIIKDNTFRKHGIEIISYDNKEVKLNSKGYHLSIHPFFFRNKLSVHTSSSSTSSTPLSTSTVNSPKPTPFYVDDAGIAKQLNQSIFDILSRSRYLSTLNHENLAEFISSEPSKKHHDQIFLISEDYNNSLLKEIEKQAKNQTPIPEHTVGRYAYQILKALSYLHSKDLTHRSLSLENIKLDSNGQIKLTNYGLYFLSDEGENVSFPIGNAFYLSPETILRGAKGSSNTKTDIWALGCILLQLMLGYCIWEDRDPVVVINRLLYLSGISSTEKFNFKKKLFVNINEKESESEESEDSEEEIEQELNEEEENDSSRIKLNNKQLIKKFLESLKEINKENLLGIGLNDISEEFLEVIEHCLIANPSERPDSETLLDHPYFNEYKKEDPYQLDYIVKPYTKSFQLPDSLEGLTVADLEKYSASISLNSNSNSSIGDNDVFSGSEIYYLWKLMGGDIEKELVNGGYAKPSPSVHKLPLFVPIKASLTESSNSVLNFNSNNNLLSLEQQQQSFQLQHNNNQPNIIKSKNSTLYTNEFCLVGLKPLFIKIIDSLKNYKKEAFEEESQKLFEAGSGQIPNVQYQILLIREFHKLLYQYQYDDPTLSQPKIYRLAKSYIPSVLRGDIWSAILGVNESEAVQLYNSINLDQKGPNDKQFELDIPRCHQYHPLLSSKQGHQQLFKILKAWSLLNVEKGCYWQGLDNVATPFLVHHFFSEAMAFASLKAFVDKYLKILYVPNNFAALSEIMLNYQQLMAYHDPELLIHLIDIQLEPNLYAIPWFITVFAHVLPIDKLEILWDSILLCPSSLPNFIAVSMLTQFRNSILKMSFENGIKMISMIPSINVHQCVKDALHMFNITPLSTTVNKFVSNADQELWWMQEVPIEKRKLELFPRIDIHDLINDTLKIIIDIRPQNMFQQLYYPNSININPKNSKLQQQMEQYKGQPIVIIAPKDSGVEFCNQLIHWNFPYVSMLNGGMDALEHGAFSLLKSQTSK